MRSIYLISTFIFSCLLIQTNSAFTNSNEEQIKWFESGNKYLKKNKLDIALSQFHVAYIYDKTSKMGISARQKIDSLLPIVQKAILKNLKGNWKIKELNFNPYPGKFSEYIRFDYNEIIFYKKQPNGKLIPIRSEPVNFVSYDPMKILNTHQVVFKNSEIWSFWISKKNGEKRLYPKMEKDSFGEIRTLLDERGIIIDKKLRERELKKEIYTYYTRVK